MKECVQDRTGEMAELGFSPGQSPSGAWVLNFQSKHPRSSLVPEGLGDEFYIWQMKAPGSQGGVGGRRMGDEAAGCCRPLCGWGFSSGYSGKPPDGSRKGTDMVSQVLEEMALEEENGSWE